MYYLQFRCRKLISICLCLFSLMLCNQRSAAESVYKGNCSGYSTVGWTDPLSDIRIELGNPLKIFCSLDLDKVEGYNASNLAFQCNSTTISSQYVTVLNESTSLLYIPSPGISQCMYYCKLLTNTNAVYQVTSLESSSSSQVYDTNERLICVNNVVVGTKPAPAENVSCVSYNLEKLVCSWSVPYNPIKTEYRALYKVRPKDPIIFDCPENQNLRYSNNCTWTAASSPIYRNTFENLYIRVTGTNEFGNSSVSYNFPNYARMIPIAPINLTKENKTTTSVYLTWEVDLKLLFYKKLIYKIEYKWPGLDHWKSIEQYYDGDDTKFKYNVTGLPYPNTAYDFRVYIRSGIDRNRSDVFWSDPAKYVVKTEPCAPYHSPKTVTGAFEVENGSNGKRDVYVYWQSLLPEEQNGDDFRYEVIGKMLDADIDIKPFKIDNAYAMFSNISSSSYRFRITSVNKEGRSPTSSEVFLPATNDIIKAPELLTSTDSGNGVYEISWQYSTNSKNITNFTVFWCESGRHQLPWCEGRLCFDSLPPDANTFNVSTSEPKKPYNFAISANKDRSSSGMTRAKCNVFPGKISKISTVWTDKVGPNFIPVVWKLECLGRKLIKGFYLFYSAKNETERNITVPFDDSSSLAVGNITDLKPYTNYTIYVAGYSEETIGQRSDKLTSTTQEGSPDISNLNLTIKVTNTTISLNWNEPIVMNGHFNFYEIRCDSETLTTDNTNVTLKNLKPYTEHAVSIFVCMTTTCFKIYNETITTAVGIPGVIKNLNYKKHNSNTHNIIWEPPSERGGPYLNYNITVYNNRTSTSYKTNMTALLVKIPECEENDYSVVVQSETVDDAGVKYKGNSSDPHPIACEPGESLIPYLVVYFVIFSLIVLIVLLGRISIRKCRKMKEIEVSLPPFLISTGKENTELSNDPWDDKNESHRLNVKLREKDYQDDIENTPIDMIRRTDEDTDPYSSGCCTGRSSTASSVTGRTHTSSDSGTEMELKAIDSSLSAEYAEENAHPNNGYSVPPHETSLLITSTSASDLKWDLPAARFSFVSTSSDGGDCACVYTPILAMSDGTSTATVPATVTTATPGYVTIDHFPSSNEHGNTIASHQMSNNGYVTVVPKTTPYSASPDTIAGIVPPPGYCRVTGK